MIALLDILPIDGSGKVINADEILDGPIIAPFGPTIWPYIVGAVLVVAAVVAIVIVAVNKKKKK